MKIVEAVENEVKAVAEDVYAGVKEFENAVIGEAEKVKDVLQAEEKLVLRTIENTFLKAQAEAQAAQQKMKDLEVQFNQHVKSFAEKYVIDPVEHSFDVAKQVFQVIEKAL